MIGSTIGHYQITAKLGEGGMGEVYRATDARLNREVAIKVLPDSFAQDSDRLSRFQREAQVLASLNHTNIAQIYGLEQQDDRQAIVLELVEGETLADRIRRGAIPVEDALGIALQITQALEAAHEKGIVHRDLKPANVKIAPDGTVKVLDFGIAKALSTEAEEYDMSMSPTLTAPATQAGVIMGTAAYMSPEQARGRPVDRRADMWAFGCVLYEMLTGRGPFEGEDVTEVLAHIITREPDLAALPADLPDSVRDLIGRSLRKDASMRLPDIGAARIAILESEGAQAGLVVPGEEQTSPSVLRLALIGLVALAAGLGLGWMLRGGTPGTTGEIAATHFDLALDPPLGHVSMALSPDGGTVIYSGLTEGKRQLYRRDLYGFASQPIPETEGARWPFFAPDGQRIGFFAAGRLKVVSLQGGLAQPVCGVPGSIRGVIWYPDDRIVYSSRMLSVPHVVSASGGQSQALELEGLGAGESLTLPAPLPGDDVFLATVETPSPDDSRVVVVHVSDGTMKTLVRGSAARYVEPKLIVFLQRDLFMMAPFDLSTLELTGPERPADLDAPALDLRNAENHFDLSIATNGTLLYPSGAFGESTDLYWLSRDGTVEPTGIAGIFPELNDTGSRAIIQLDSGDDDIWLVDLDEGDPTRLTFTGQTTYARWSRAEQDVIYGNHKRGGFSIYVVRVDVGGEPRLLLGESEELPSVVPTSIHPDGRIMFYAVHPETSRDIYVLDEDGKHEPVLHTGANERAGVLSPDGNLFAYVSDEDGSDKLFLREFPETGRRWPVADAGMSPVWSRDGRELFFRVGDAILVAPVEREGGLRVGEAVEIFRSDRIYRDDWGNATFDAAPDGRLLISLRDREDVRPRVVLNWDPGVDPSR